MKKSRYTPDQVAFSLRRASGATSEPKVDAASPSATTLTPNLCRQTTSQGCCPNSITKNAVNHTD